MCLATSGDKLWGQVEVFVDAPFGLQVTIFSFACVFEQIV